jgi:hypothetical protein
MMMVSAGSFFVSSFVPPWEELIPKDHQPK